MPSQWDREEAFIWEYLSQPLDVCTLRIQRLVSSDNVYHEFYKLANDAWLEPLKFLRTSSLSYPACKLGDIKFEGKSGVDIVLGWGLDVDHVPIAFLSDVLVQQAARGEWSTIMVSLDRMVKSTSPIQFLSRSEFISGRKLRMDRTTTVNKYYVPRPVDCSAADFRTAYQDVRRWQTVIMDNARQVSQEVSAFEGDRIASILQVLDSSRERLDPTTDIVGFARARRRRASSKNLILCLITVDLLKDRAQLQTVADRLAHFSHDPTVATSALGSHVSKRVTSKSVVQAAQLTLDAALLYVWKDKHKDEKLIKFVGPTVPRKEDLIGCSYSACTSRALRCSAPSLRPRSLPIPKSS